MSSFLDWDTLVLLLLISRNTSVLFSSFIFLVLFEPRPGSSVVDSSSGGMVAPPAGTAASLSNPSVFPKSAAVSCLAPSSPDFSCAVFEHSVGLVCR